jgi:hypothetical protein
VQLPASAYRSTCRAAVRGADTDRADQAPSHRGRAVGGASAARNRRVEPVARQRRVGCELGFCEGGSAGFFPGLWLSCRPPLAMPPTLRRRKRSASEQVTQPHLFDKDTSKKVQTSWRQSQTVAVSSITSRRVGRLSSYALTIAINCSPFLVNGSHFGNYLFACV